MKMYSIDNELLEALKIVILGSSPVSNTYSNRDIINIFSRLNALEEIEKKEKKEK